MRQFFPKMDVFGIIFIDRNKNKEAMTALGINYVMSKEIVRDIKTIDYVETIMDAFSFGDMWVFGKDFDGQELYVKISMGRPNSNTICISLHLAEHPLRYAFKIGKEQK